MLVVTITESVFSFSNQSTYSQFENAITNDEVTLNTSIQCELKNIKEFVSLSISNSFELQRILNESNNIRNKVKELIINDNSCNDIKGYLKIDGFDNLEKIVVEKNALIYLEILEISKNKELRTIEIENGEYYTNGALYNLKNVIVDSILIDLLAFISS